jgi:hypothetical protein
MGYLPTLVKKAVANHVGKISRRALVTEEGREGDVSAGQSLGRLLNVDRHQACCDIGTMIVRTHDAVGLRLLSLSNHNDGIVQPFFANQIEQHGSMPRTEPDTAGRRRSAQSRSLICAVNGVVAIIED